MRPSTRQYSGVSPDAGTATADVRDNSESMVGTLHAALAGSRGLSASAASVQSRNCQLFWAETTTTLIAMAAINMSDLPLSIDSPLQERQENRRKFSCSPISPAIRDRRRNKWKRPLNDC